MGEMTGPDRMWAVLHGELPDRVPLDIWATGEVWTRLREHFGTNDTTAIKQRLGIDGFHGVTPPYVGPDLPEPPPGETVDWWRMRYRPMAYETGVYQEQCHYPLAHVSSVAELDDYPWPQADWFDYAAAAAACAGASLPVSAGYAAPFYFFNKLRGLEQSLLDLVLNPELADAILERLTAFFLDYHDRLFTACGGKVAVSQLTDDFGSQTGLLISPAAFDRFMLPHYRRLAGLMHDHNVIIFHHDDGAMWDLIPRLLDLGVRVLNPIQYRCGPIDLAWLKATYGDRLVFHGAVDNQEVLPFGTPDEVRAEVRKCLRDLSGGGGYILAPCHNLQAVTPVENIIALYETAVAEGGY